MKRILLAAVVILAVLAATAVPAHADPTTKYPQFEGLPCNLGSFCTYDGPYRTGAQYNYNSNTHGCVNIGSAWNDRIASAANRLQPTNRIVWMYKEANCSGQVQQVNNGYQVTFTAWGGMYAKTSSFYIYP